MGINLKRIFRSRETPDTERVSAMEITNQEIQEAADSICLRELAFWTCVGKIANMIAKCEFRTFVNGKETFGDEYYLWNYSPNKNQNKSEFIKKALARLYRNNELLIVESYDGQLLIADGFSVTQNTLYGDTYSEVSVDDYQFQRTFHSNEVLYWKLNDRNINQVLGSLYNAYSNLIQYSTQAYLKSRGSRGILDIGAVAQNSKNFSENLKKLMNEYFRSFFHSANAVLPLYEGYKYTDLGSKTYSEGTTRDIKGQYDDIFDFTAKAFLMSPSLAKGDVQDTSKALDETLTFCIDPLCNMLQEEINRKRNGAENLKRGTYLTISTTRVKHRNLFDVASQADKLISSGVATVNMLLRALGEPQVDAEWANQHFITKNYSNIENLEGGETLENDELLL